MSKRYKGRTTPAWVHKLQQEEETPCINCGLPGRHLGKKGSLFVGNQYPGTK